MMETILEILKYTIPGLVVFAAVYYIQRQHNDSQYQMKALESQGKYSKNTIQLKLQAYERLLLFCDRIMVPNLILRLKSQDMTSDQLKTAMIISVQKEYEHNLAQQLYTSQKLWDILTLTKNDIIAIISGTAKSLAAGASAEDLANSLMSKTSAMKSNPISLATKAIKEEAKIILNV